jgi:hypothetical protein
MRKLDPAGAPMFLRSSGKNSFKVNYMKKTTLRLRLVMTTALVVLLAANFTFAQGKSDKKAEKQEMKQLNKEANKTGAKAEETADQLGRNVVFCILAAHTTGVGNAQQLKDAFNALENFPFGQFVAAVLLADRTDLTLQTILAKMKNDDMSIGQIAREANENMGEIRGHFGQFRSELARSQTNPPTTCF